MTDSGGVKAAQWMDAKTLAEHLVPLLQHFDVKWRGHGFIYVDHEEYNIETSRRVLVGLSANLGVPTQLLRSRLVDLGWLRDVRSALPVREDVIRIIEKLDSWTEDVEEDDFERDEDYDND